jgi:hypothetical protein
MVTQHTDPSAAHTPHTPGTNQHTPHNNTTRTAPRSNPAHRELNNNWREYFTRHTAEEAEPPILPDNLLPNNNVPWGPDAHGHQDAYFRIYFQNLHGIAPVKSTLPSWTATMDFLQGLQVSLFAFSEPNLQWMGALLREAKNTQRRFFSHGHLVTSESALEFPTTFKPGGTCIGVNGK